MLRHIWAWVDDDQLVLAHQICLRPEIGEWRRVARQQPRDAGLKLLGNGVGRVHPTAPAMRLVVGQIQTPTSAPVPLAATAPARTAARRRARA